jgi:hypothetical protein
MLCLLFGLPADQLGLVESSEPVELADETSRGLDDVERRDFIRKMGAGIGAALLPQAFEPLGAEPWEALGTALRRPNGMNWAAVDHLESRTAGLYQLEERIPARQLADAVLRHLTLLTNVLDLSPRPALRPRLVSLAGETAALAGWLSFDVNDLASARSLLEVALDAAEEAGDRALAACVLGYRSYMASDAVEARGLLVEAQCRVSGVEHPATRSWLAGREAEENAAAGDADASARALDRAENAFAVACPEQERVWTKFFDRPRLDSLAIAMYVRLGQAGPAQAAADAVLATLPADELKKRTIILADVASAHAEQGDPDEACRLGADALATGIRTECTIGLRRVHELRARLDRWQELQVVRSFHEQLTAAM